MLTLEPDIRCADARVGLVCFEAGGRSYALEVGQVREIVRSAVVTPLPKAPALIEGVIDLRGSVLPVIDLGRALGDDAVGDEAPHARIAVLEADGLVLGLRVAAALDVLSLPIEVLEDPPALALQTGYDAVRAVVRRPREEPILVLSLEHLLESVFRSAIAGRPAGGDR
jgi:purine-binding chemotaxis protein CheW